MITQTQSLTEVRLETENLVSMRAWGFTRGRIDCLVDAGNQWSFDEAAARETAKFFTIIADELARRKSA